MFLKVLENGKETIFHCKRVSMIDRHVKKDNSTIPTIFLIIDDGGRGEQTFEFNRNQLEIIFMNDNGKTVDRRTYEN